MYKLVLAIGAVAAVCFGAGCGGGAGNSDPLTKTEYLSKANQICKENQADRKAAIAAWERETAKQASAKSSARLDEGLKTVVAPLLQQEAEELNGLQPPRKDKPMIAKMVSTLSKVSKTVAKEGAKAVPRSGLARFIHEASAYGLKGCTNF